MKIKSKAVRRNSSGYRLQEDDPVSGDPIAVTDCSVSPAPNGLGVGDSFLVGSGSASNCAVNEGDQFGDFMDVDDAWVSDNVSDGVGPTPMRMTSGRAAFVYYKLHNSQFGRLVTTGN